MGIDSALKAHAVETFHAIQGPIICFRITSDFVQWEALR
jgi:hypothetical protein